MGEPEFQTVTALEDVKAFQAEHQADIQAADDAVRKWIHPVEANAPLVSDVIGWYAGIDLWALYDRARILRHLSKDLSPYDEILHNDAFVAAEEAWTGKGGKAFFLYCKDGGQGSNNFNTYLESVKSAAEDHYNALSAPNGNDGLLGALRMALSDFLTVINGSIKNFQSIQEKNFEPSTSIEPAQFMVDLIVGVYKATMKDADQIGNASDAVADQVAMFAEGNLVSLNPSNLDVTSTDDLAAGPGDFDGGWKPR